MRAGVGACSPALAASWGSRDDLEGDIQAGWDLRIRTARDDIMHWAGECHCQFTAGRPTGGGGAGGSLVPLHSIFQQL
jgi:hypothetical protein